MSAYAGIMDGDLLTEMLFCLHLNRVNQSLLDRLYVTSGVSLPGIRAYGHTCAPNDSLEQYEATLRVIIGGSHVLRTFSSREGPTNE